MYIYYIAVAWIVFIIGMGFAVGFYAPTKLVLDSEEGKRVIIKDCNRKGGIYSDGVCQHVFAPICRRL